jgi:hypothetical protein
MLNEFRFCGEAPGAIMTVKSCCGSVLRKFMFCPCLPVGEGVEKVETTG